LKQLLKRTGEEMTGLNLYRRVTRFVVALAATGLGLALVPSGASAVAASDATTSHTCNEPVVTNDVAKVVCPYAGAAASWRMPEGVTSVTFDLYGAQGGSQPDTLHTAPGGLGAHVHARLSLKPGQELMIVVGGRPAPNSGAGGFNGGGSAQGPAGRFSSTGGGGGGATDVRTGPGYTLASRVLVAGGGGGNGGNAYNYSSTIIWSQGAPGGTSEEPGCCGINGGGGGSPYGYGGTGGAGGADIVYEQPPSHAPDGSPGAWGAGGTAPAGWGSESGGGGGGGGGYYGGGGGGAAGRCFSTPEQCAGYTAAGFGGGGGSDYSSAYNGWVIDGVRQGNGAVIITYRVP
jgi:hypothetical protein